MEFYCLVASERSRFQPGIVAIEQSATYPLGDDFFQIDHGSNYFAFFDRLGEVKYHLAMDGDTVAAVGAGVLRQISYYQGEAPRPAWYLCDLKVHPNYQRQRLSLRLLRQVIPLQALRCAQGYAISMNSHPSLNFNRSSNPLVRVLEKFSPIKFRSVTTLGIYSLDEDQMRYLEPLLVEHRGLLSYLSLRGKKDLRLQSNGKILLLLHVQWGMTARLEVTTPRSGYIHMFCAPTDDRLAIALAHHGVTPQATASVISGGMASDWLFILTSDI